MPGNRVALSLTVLLALVVVVVLTWPHPHPEVRPECPTDSIIMPSSDATVIVRHELAGPGPITLVPEYHDCQRLLVGEGMHFGPLVAVFATYKPDSIRQVHGTGGPVAVFASGSEQAAATLLNYDAPYGPLRIESGISCLYLLSQANQWRAHMVHVTTDSACMKPMGENPGGFDLNVAVLPVPVGDSIPPVARWDWDPDAFKQFIGIRCGRQWCEVFDSSQNRFNARLGYEGASQAAVKGWFDEQYLAVADNTVQIGLSPGHALGTIIPVEGLGTFVDSNYANRWQKVATVALSVPSTKYLDKFNFIEAKPGHGGSDVFLCKGERTECGIPDAADIPACQNEQDKWWSKIVAQGRDKYRCVIRRTHDGVEIPGMVRWRWQTDDDDMWVRCPTGCCQVT